MEKGIELFNRGELGDAILAFEAAVQKDMQNSDAWRRLGESHAENDRFCSRVLICRVPGLTCVTAEMTERSRHCQEPALSGLTTQRLY